MTFNDAEAKCVQEGSQLVTIDSNRTFEAVVQYLKHLQWVCETEKVT